MDVRSSPREVSCTACEVVKLFAQAYVRVIIFSVESLLPENQEFWRIDAIPLQFFLEHRHSYPSRDELRRVQRSVLQHVLLEHGNDDASRLCSLHHCMHLSWSNNIFVSFKRFISRVGGKDDDDEAADDEDEETNTYERTKYQQQKKYEGRFKNGR